MEKLKTTVRATVMLLALFGALSLAQIGGLTQSAVAENGSGEVPSDSTGTPEPIYQPTGTGFFEAMGIFFEAMY